MRHTDNSFRTILLAFAFAVSLGLPLYAVGDSAEKIPSTVKKDVAQAELVPANSSSISNYPSQQKPVPVRPAQEKAKRAKYISFGAAIVAGILLSILANALHAWLGLTVLCIIAQKIVPPSAFDQFSIPYLSSYTLYSKEFLAFLITACCVETGQKFIPVVSHFFNILNGVVKPVLTVVMIAMIAKFADPDISNLVLRPMEIIGGVTVFGLHFGKHAIKWPFASILGPHTAWAIVELIAVVFITGAGIWVLA